MTHTLCSSCTNSIIIQGEAESEEVIRCFSRCSCSGVLITFPVVECSSYQKEGEMSLFTMMDIAYILTIRSGGPAGFKTSQQFRKENPDENIIPPHKDDL